MNTVIQITLLYKQQISLDFVGDIKLSMETM